MTNSLADAWYKARGLAIPTEMVRGREDEGAEEEAAGRQKLYEGAAEAARRQEEARQEQAARGQLALRAPEFSQRIFAYYTPVGGMRDHLFAQAKMGLATFGYVIARDDTDTGNRPRGPDPAGEEKKPYVYTDWTLRRGASQTYETPRDLNLFLYPGSEETAELAAAIGIAKVAPPPATQYQTPEEYYDDVVVEPTTESEDDVNERYAAQTPLETAEYFETVQADLKRVVGSDSLTKDTLFDEGYPYTYSPAHHSFDVRFDAPEGGDSPITHSYTLATAEYAQAVMYREGSAPIPDAGRHGDLAAMLRRGIVEIAIKNASDELSDLALRLCEETHEMLMENNVGGERDAMSRLRNVMRAMQEISRMLDVTYLSLNFHPIIMNSELYNLCGMLLYAMLARASVVQDAYGLMLAFPVVVWTLDRNAHGGRRDYRFGTMPHSVTILNPTKIEKWGSFVDEEGETDPNAAYDAWLDDRFEGNEGAANEAADMLENDDDD